MSDILDRMAAAHEERNLVAVNVPEYATTWHFYPLTLSERSRVRKKASGSEDDMILSVETLILKALDADGKPVFPDNGKTRNVLMQMDVTVLQRIMSEAQGDPVTDTAKND